LFEKPLMHDDISHSKGGIELKNKELIIQHELTTQNLLMLNRTYNRIIFQVFIHVNLFKPKPRVNQSHQKDMVSFITLKTKSFGFI